MASRVSRVGVGFLLIGVFAAVLSVVVVPAFISSFTFHGGVLVLSLGAATIAVEPTSPRDVLIATAVGVTGLVGLAVGLVVTSDGRTTVVQTLSREVLPLVPMSVGYIFGGLYSVSDCSDRQSVRIGGLSILAGLIVWAGSYALFVLTHDTTGELGIHTGFLFAIYVLMLLADCIRATFLYALWRITDRLPAESTTSTRSHG